MRAPMAFFAGAGTVIAAIGIGLGGGLTVANVMSPHQGKLEQTKLERRMSAKPTAPSNQTDEPKPENPAVTQAAATPPAAPADAQPKSSAQPQTQAAAPREQAEPPRRDLKPVTNKPASTRPANVKAATEQRATSPEPLRQASKDASTASDAPASAEQAASSPEDANAKARDADLKRLAAEKRKSERRQQWVERRKARPQRDDLRDVEASVRRDIDGPRIVTNQDGDYDRRGGFDRPTRFGFPGFSIFGGDDRD